MLFLTAGQSPQMEISEMQLLMTGNFYLHRLPSRCPPPFPSLARAAALPWWHTTGQAFFGLKFPDPGHWAGRQVLVFAQGGWEDHVAVATGVARPSLQAEACL